MWWMRCPPMLLLIKMCSNGRLFLPVNASPPQKPTYKHLLKLSGCQTFSHQGPLIWLKLDHGPSFDMILSQGPPSEKNLDFKCKHMSLWPKQWHIQSLSYWDCISIKKTGNITTTDAIIWRNPVPSGLTLIVWGNNPLLYCTTLSAYTIITCYSLAIQYYWPALRNLVHLHSPSHTNRPRGT